MWKCFNVTDSWLIKKPLLCFQLSLLFIRRISRRNFWHFDVSVSALTDNSHNTPINIEVALGFLERGSRINIFWPFLSGMTVFFLCSAINNIYVPFLGRHTRKSHLSVHWQISCYLTDITFCIIHFHFAVILIKNQDFWF